MKKMSDGSSSQKTSKRKVKWNTSSKLNKLLADSSEDENETGKEEESSDDEPTKETMMRFMREMGQDVVNRKPVRNSFMFNAAIAVMGMCFGILITQFYAGGAWKSVKLCHTENPPRFCQNCFGPFRGEWLWCLLDSSQPV